MDEIDELIMGVGATPSAQNRGIMIKNLRRKGLVDTAGRLRPSVDRTQTLIDLKIDQYREQGIVTSQSVLRAEFPLTGSINNIIFNVQANQANASGENIPTQILLDQNDTFTATGLGIYIKTAVTVGSAQPTAEEHAKAILRTYPNPEIFSVAGEAAALQAIYNGKMNVKLDVTDFIPAYEALRNYRVPMSQQNVGTATGVVGVQRDEWPVPMFGANEVKPSFEFSGQTQVAFNLNLNASVNMGTGLATRRNYAVLIVTGLLHSGANSAYQARQSKSQKMR